MAINTEDGDFGLDCWENGNGDGEPVYTEYSDDRGELEKRATELVEEGRFQYVVLSQWNDDADDWDALDEFTADEEAA